MEVQRVTLDGVILAVTDGDIPQQMAWGQFVEIRADGVKLRPWKVRWSTPAELDSMAAAAGLVLCRTAFILGEGSVHRRTVSTTCRSTDCPRDGGRFKGAMSGISDR